LHHVGTYGRTDVGRIHDARTNYIDAAPVPIPPTPAPIVAVTPAMVSPTVVVMVVMIPPMSIVGVVVGPRAVMPDVVPVMRADVVMSDPMMSRTMVARMCDMVCVPAMGVSVCVVSMTPMAVRSMSAPVPAMAAAG